MPPPPPPPPSPALPAVPAAPPSALSPALEPMLPEAPLAAEPLPALRSASGCSAVFVAPAAPTLPAAPLSDAGLCAESAQPTAKGQHEEAEGKARTNAEVFHGLTRFFELWKSAKPSEGKDKSPLRGESGHKSWMLSNFARTTHASGGARSALSAALFLHGKPKRIAN